MSSNSSVLTIIPPPAGQTSNFVNPHSMAVRMTITNAICLSVSSIAVMLRMYTRYWLVNSVKLDDYLVLVAIACAASGSIVSQNMIPYGLGRHAWDVPFTHLSPFLKRWMIGAITYSTSILMTKLSFLFLYRRIFTNNKSFALQWWIVLVVIVGYGIAGIFSNLLNCLPIEMTWDVTITNGVCINKAVFYMVNACLNVLTDLAIFALPMIPIWRTFSSRRQRIFLLMLFGTGSFTCVVSMIRIKFIVDFLKIGAGDITHAGTSLVIWTVIEMHSAIICACAATLKPFIQRYFGPIFTSTHDSTPSNYVQATDYSGQQTRDAKATQLSTSTTNSYSHSSSDGNAHDDVEIGPFRELAASSSAFGSGYGDHGSSTTNVCKGPTLDSYEVVL